MVCLVFQCPACGSFDQRWFEDADRGRGYWTICADCGAPDATYVSGTIA